VDKLRVPYGLAVHGEEEEKAVLEVLRSHRTIMGDKTKEFEEKVAALFGKKHGIMVNSGSSANLLAIECLDLPKGSEVITPVLTFSTTVSPLVQKGLTPVFVDVALETLLTDVKQMKDAVTEETKALMIPSLLGNIPDMSFVRQVADENDLTYIEDSCDTIGATFNGKPTGAYSEISTTSFYGSHVITAGGGGGMVCVNDEDWNLKCRVLRGWGRSSAIDETEDVRKRFGVKLEDVQYDSKFIFNEIAYNFLPLEMSAAFGLEQLKKQPMFSKIRQQNFNELRRFFLQYEDFFILSRQLESVETNWLAYPVIIKSSEPFRRLDIVTYLEENNIQTRPVFTGNILKQPAFKNINHKTFSKDFPNADHIMKNGFLIGCNHGLTSKHIAHMEEVFSSFLSKF
jgi:CDP-6-deoxy-D-xylo-4-hexulose-3-dehydrase